MARTQPQGSGVSRSGTRAVRLVFWLLGTVLLAIVVLPLLRLALQPSLASLAAAVNDIEVREALWLSVAGAFFAAVLSALFGIPLAYVLARSEFRGRGLIGAIVDLPLSVPHTVAGIALLMVFGRRGIIGAPADALLGVRFWATLAGIVVAMLFVSAPYTVNSARIGFQSVDQRLEMVARTLGLGPMARALARNLAACLARHRHRADPDFRAGDQRILRSRDPRLLSDDGTGEDLRALLAHRARRSLGGRRAAARFVVGSVCAVSPFRLWHDHRRYREMSRAGLDASDLTLQLGSFTLRGASLAVEPGEALALLGPNGAGKSVCLEAIAGFHRLARGSIQIGGRDVTALPPEQRRIGFVVQNFALFPHLSVEANVRLGARGHGNHVDIAGLLNRFGIAHLAAAQPTYLSPGEKQRVALARALGSRPELFLFDEPFAALDAATAFTLRDELAGFLRDSGLPAIFVTHDHTEARALADQVAIIEAGVIQQRGRATEVFDHPATPVIARFLGIENLLEGRIAAIEGERIRIDLGGGVIEAVRPEPAIATGQSVTLCIRAENVNLHPPQSSRQRGIIAARVVAIRPSGPLWTVNLDAGFPLIAYALPQTARECGLAPGASVDAEVEPTAVHALISPAGPEIAATLDSSS